MSTVLHSFDVHLVVTRRAGNVDFGDEMAEDVRVADQIRARLEVAVPDGGELVTSAARYEIQRYDVRQADPDRFVHWIDTKERTAP